MKTSLFVGLVSVLLASCAPTTPTGNAAAEQQCANLARAEGLKLVRVDGIDAGSQNVRLRVEDRLGRAFDATCTPTATGPARWAQPLPSNVVRG